MVLGNQFPILGGAQKEILVHLPFVVNYLCTYLKQDVNLMGGGDNMEVPTEYNKIKQFETIGGSQNNIQLLCTTQNNIQFINNKLPTTKLLPT